MIRFLRFVFLSLLLQSEMSAQDVIERYAEAMTLRKQDVEDCLHNAGLTLEGLIKIHNMPEDDLNRPEMQEILMKTGCFLACMYQRQGTMEGGKLLVPEMHEIITKRYSDNPSVNTALHGTVDNCVEQVKDKTRECEVAIGFTACISTAMRLKEAEMASG